MRTYNTLQEVFNGVWDHFITKGNPRGYNTKEERCTFVGTGCAVGCLIDDKDLCKSMDNYASFGDIMQGEKVPQTIKDQLSTIFTGLKTDAYRIQHVAMFQCMHDSAFLSNYIDYPEFDNGSCNWDSKNVIEEFPTVFKKRLEVFARKHGLKEPV